MADIVVYPDIDQFLRSATFSIARVTLGAAPIVHTHLSADVTDATTIAAPNMLAKHDALGNLKANAYQLSSGSAYGPTSIFFTNGVDPTSTILMGTMTFDRIHRTPDGDGYLALTVNPNGTIPIGGIVGLQAALDAKAPTTHAHAISDVAGLQAALDGKVAPQNRIIQIHGLSVYMDAARINTQVAVPLADGAAMAGWLSTVKFGTGYLTWSVSGTPLYKTTPSPNLTPGVLLDGVDDFFTTPEIFRNLTNTQEFTIIAVVKPSALTAIGGAIYNQRNILCDGGAVSGLAVSASGANHIYTAWYYDVDGQKAVSTLPIAPTANVLLTMMYRDGQLSIRAGNAAAVSIAAKIMINTGAGAMQIGKGQGASSFFAGTIYELLMWGRGLSDAELSTVRTILLAKLGI